MCTVIFFSCRWLTSFLHLQHFQAIDKSMKTVKMSNCWIVDDCLCYGLKSELPAVLLSHGCVTSLQRKETSPPRWPSQSAVCCDSPSSTQIQLGSVSQLHESGRFREKTTTNIGCWKILLISYLLCLGLFNKEMRRKPNVGDFRLGGRNTMVGVLLLGEYQKWPFLSMHSFLKKKPLRCRNLFMLVIKKISSNEFSPKTGSLSVWHANSSSMVFRVINCCTDFRAVLN